MQESADAAARRQKLNPDDHRGHGLRQGGCVNGPAKISDVRESVAGRRQLMLSVDDRSIADNLEMSDFKEIDMKDGRNRHENLQKSASDSG